MQVRDIMTENPACCSADSSIQEAAQMMVDCDCGEIPVVDDQDRPVGVITDRDICCRAVAEGLDCETSVGDIMSSPAVCVSPQDSVEDCCQLMDENQIRRVPVVDEAGVCCGIVSQADIAQVVEDSDSGRFLRDVSRQTASASHAH